MPVSKKKIVITFQSLIAGTDHTLHSLAATSLYPRCSNLLVMSPIRHLCTPSGLTAMKVRSLRVSAILVNADKIVRSVATMRSSEKGRAEAKCHVVENDASVCAYGNNRRLTETIK